MSANKILERRRFVASARLLPFWILVNLSSFAICLADFNYSVFSSIFYLSLIQYLIWFIESLLMLIFLFNFSYDLYLYVWFKKFMLPIELTSREYMLYGINEKENGFKLKPSDDCKNSIKKSPKYFSTPSFEMSSTSLIDKHSSLDSTALSTRLFDSSVDSPHSKYFSNLRHDSDSSFKLNNSNNLQNTSNQSLNSSNTELKFRKSNSFLFKRKNIISSQNDLQNYLKAQNMREEEINELIRSQKQYNSTNENISSVTPIQNSPYSPQANTSTPSTQKYSPQKNLYNSMNSPNTSGTIPYNTVLSYNSTNFEQNITKTSPENHQSSPYPAYQPAIKINSLPNSPEKSETFNFNGVVTKSLEKLMIKLETDDLRLNQMVGNIRKWISQTILSRLIEEINSINKLITELGHIDSLIGETTINQLRHLSSTKKTDFSTLDQVCNFLDINVRNIDNNITFQQYLVRRLKDLAKGGCMMEFLWDNGGSYNYKHWKDDMITDSELILHIFCVYMDSRLLFNPTVPEGKPFTSQHFRAFKGPVPKSDTYIQQEKSYPPYYSVVLQSEIFELPPGRNNLFYALLVFLHHIKVKNYGLLGRINIKPSGLNIAWVIDK